METSINQNEQADFWADPVGIFLQNHIFTLQTVFHLFKSQKGLGIQHTSNSAKPLNRCLHKNAIY